MGAVDARQEAIYHDPTQWEESTPVTWTARLRYVLRFLTLLDVYGVRGSSERLQGGLRILEPGCGVGSLSSVLQLFGTVTSLDLSEEAVRAAEGLFGHLSGIHFLRADATQPAAIDALRGVEFDFILLREFTPLKPPASADPGTLVAAYCALLRRGGVLIIEYGLPLTEWRRSWPQMKRVLRARGGRAAPTMALDIAAVLSAGLQTRHPWLFWSIARACSPIAMVYCLARGIRLSRSFVIQRR